MSQPIILPAVQPAIQPIIRPIGEPINEPISPHPGTPLDLPPAPAAGAPAAAKAPTLGHLLRPVDFQRVLGLPPRSRSAHFSVHHVAGGPALPAKPARLAVSGKLSTGDARSCPPAVDDRPEKPVNGRWLGLVVPKRHAKRAVTRSLIKRQMRAVMQAHASHLTWGLWVLRLRAPFDRKVFVSAASERLRGAVHDELTLLVQRAASRG